MSGEAAMQAKMQEVFQAANKSLKFWKDTSSSPNLWKVIVDGKRLGESRDEATAFQQALDKSGIGGKISYKPAGGINWKFSYSPKKGA